MTKPSKTLPKRLPKEFELAGGYRVQVVLQPRAVLNQGLGTPSDGGYWDKDTMTVFIEKELSPGEQWYVLLHEQVHAALDDLDHYTETCTCRVRSRPTHDTDGLVRPINTPLTVDSLPVHHEGPVHTGDEKTRD